MTASYESSSLSFTGMVKLKKERVPSVLSTQAYPDVLYDLTTYIHPYALTPISSLINDLLDVSRITEGKMDLHRAMFVIADLIRTCCGFRLQNRA